MRRDEIVAKARYEGAKGPSRHIIEVHRPHPHGQFWVSYHTLPPERVARWSEVRTCDLSTFARWAKRRVEPADAQP